MNFFRFAAPMAYTRSVVLIDAFREIDLRPADVQKRVRIAVGQLARLSRIDDVIRNRGHAGRKLGLGPIRSEGLNQRHEIPFHDEIGLGLAAGINLPDCTFPFSYAVLLLPCSSRITGVSPITFP